VTEAEHLRKSMDDLAEDLQKQLKILEEAQVAMATELGQLRSALNSALQSSGRREPNYWEEL
jgi:chaperonin cofactor prefoldin